MAKQYLKQLPSRLSHLVDLEFFSHLFNHFLCEALFYDEWLEVRQFGAIAGIDKISDSLEVFRGVFNWKPGMKVKVKVVKLFTLLFPVVDQARLGAIGEWWDDADNDDDDNDDDDAGDVCI